MSTYGGFISACGTAQCKVNGLMEDMQKPEISEDPSALLTTSLKLMQAQQQLTTMTESFTKAMKANTDAQKAAINSMA
jgi:hypothetical protein